MTRYIFPIILAFSMAGIVTQAEPADDDYTRIARISYMEGHVSFQGTTDVDWTAAAINFPLQPGDRIYTGPEGRAEIEFDEGSVLRLAENTDIQFLSLRENLIQIRVLTGLSSLNVSSGVEFEVDTPAAAFVVLSNGSYRFEAEDSGDTSAIVRKGSLDTVSHRFVRRVQSGERIFVTARENSSYNLDNYYGRDAWDEWTDRRNADRIARGSREYVPGDVYVGVSELDRHGRWVTVESYGSAWVPYSVGVSWSPYSVGRWCYRPTWGWTWVSYEPWGWLPYHYGRWYLSVQFGWCWLPGPSFSFHFWSPGLVTFYSGPSWVSWCPLGPGDYYSINNYYYNKRVYRGYVGRIKKLHYRRPGDPFNRHKRGAFKTMEIAQFRKGRSGGIATPGGYKKMDQPWKKGDVVRERLAVRPSAESFSPDPGRKAVRSKIDKPRPAVVFSEPSAKLKKQDAYERIRNKDITAQVARRSQAPGNTAAGGPERVPVSNRNRQRSDRSSPARKRTETEYTVNSGSAVPGRSETVGSGGGSARGGDSTVRSRPQIQSRQFIDSSATERPTDSRSSSGAEPGRVRNSVESDSGRNSATNGRSRSIPSVSWTRSTQQSSGSSDRGSIRVQGSSSRSDATSNSQSSSSRIRTYSVPSSRSRSGSSSVSSSRSRSGSSSVSSSRSRSGSSSVSSSSSRIRTYSVPSSRSRSGSSSISSSRSRSGSSSVSSSRSRSGSSSASSSRSSRSSSSSGSSSKSSSSKSSSSGSSSSSESSSGSSKARSRH